MALLRRHQPLEEVDSLVRLVFGPSVQQAAICEFCGGRPSETRVWIEAGYPTWDPFSVRLCYSAECCSGRVDYHRDLRPADVVDRDANRMVNRLTDLCQDLCQGAPGKAFASRGWARWWIEVVEALRAQRLRAALASM